MNARFLIALLASVLMSGPLAVAQERMPPIPEEKMTEAQKQAVAELVATPRGRLSNAFVPLLRSPEFMTRLQKTGEYLRYNSALPPQLNEFVILITARRWTQQYEWYVHHPLALKAGLRAEIAQAVAEGRRPVGMTDDEEAVFAFCDELFRTQGVSDATYARAIAKFGEQGVIDMLGVAGYYSMLSMILNTTRVPIPDGGEAPLAAFPH